MRMNIRKVKGLLWLLCVLVLALGAWTFWGIYRDKQAGRYEPRKMSEVRDLFEREQGSAEAPPRTTYYPKVSRDALSNARIDGSVKPPPEVAATPKAPSEAPKTVVPPLDSVIDISLIVSSDEPASRFIAVEYDADRAVGSAGSPGTPRPAVVAMPAGSKVSRLHLREGEPLREPWDGEPYHGRVQSIGPQEVVFRWGDGEVSLHPDLGVTGADPPVSDFSVTARVDVTADVPVQDERQVLPDGSFLMGREDKDKIRDDTSRILSEDIVAQSVTEAERGHSFILLKNVAETSIVAGYGFKSGDRIISVNGIPMPSVTAAVNWAKANGDLPTYVIVAERLGNPFTTTIHVK